MEKLCRKCGHIQHPTATCKICGYDSSGAPVCSGLPYARKVPA
jgi:hypothetical protein